MHLYDNSTYLSARILLQDRNRSWRKAAAFISVREGEEVTLHCLLQGVCLPDTCLSAIWFRGSCIRPFLTLHRTDSVQYPRENLAGRLYLHHPAANDFNLTLHSVEEGDAGLYHCWVQEWQQQGKGKDWVLQILACSKYIQLMTIPMGNAAGCKGLFIPHWFPFSHAGGTAALC